MKQSRILLSAMFVIVLSAACQKEQKAQISKEPVRIFMTAGQTGSELEHIQGLLERFNRENPDIIAELKDYSAVPQQQLGSITQIFQAGSSELDVIIVDVIWPGDLAEHLVDLQEYGISIDQRQFFPSALANGIVKGRLIALPWFIDAGLLYYRSDLLEKYGRNVPKTWQELTDTAREIQIRERAAGNKDFWGFVWPAGPGEGLTCTALELIVSNGGGTILDSDGKVTVNNPRSAEILATARSWIGDITPPEALTFSSSNNPLTWWKTGNVLFMRNWPYAYAASNQEDSPVRGKFRIAPLPAGASGKGASTLGGWLLGVSRYSLHKAEAVRLVQFLTSREIQQYRAEVAGYYPTIRSLYTDGSLERSGNPIFAQLLDVLDTTVPRPSTQASPNYNAFSQVFFTHISEILSGKVTVQNGLKNAEQALIKVLADK